MAKKFMNNYHENNEEIKDAHLEENENDSNEAGDMEEKNTGDSKDKKIKNLISLVILLFGFLIGSIFVDVAQLVKGSGVSQKVLGETDIFELDDKTWVAYSEPIVNVSVVNDDNCEECQPDEVLIWLRKMLPTLLSSRISLDSAEGEKILGESEAKSIPLFAFSSEVEKTDFYNQAQMLFYKKGDHYILNTAQLGAPAGKYIEVPQIEENDIKVGNAESNIKLIVFSDFQCPYSKAFNDTVQETLSDYSNDVLYIFKQLPLISLHPKAVDAALASECANEQDEFLDYSNKLFETQKDWGVTEGTQEFKTYARQLGLNTTQFNKCLDEKKYQEKVDKDSQEAEEFGISGTPALFINDKFKSGAVDYDTIKEIINEELN